MSENDDGQAEAEGSKTGMGIDGPMNAYALVIGVGRCKYSDWSLPVTALDARELSKTLADPALCAYPKDRIRVLSDEAATREGILEAVDDLARHAATDPDATFFVYYSGHGWRHAADGGERYCLIPHDVQPYDLATSALPAEDFIGGLRKLRGRRVLVMVDTCHAAAMADAKNLVIEAIPKDFAQEPLPKALVEELEAGKGRAVFLSCDEAQKSWILPAQGSLSIFTHHLINALNGVGSVPGERFVTVASLMRHLGQQVPASAREIGQEQTPFFKFEAQDFSVALIQGGKGLPVERDPVERDEARPPTGKAPKRSSIKIGNVDANQVNVADEIGTIQQTVHN